MDLTKRQQDIVDYIRSYSSRHGYPPTVRDIGKAVGLASSSTVHAHLANLERLGLLRRDPSKPRAIELLGKGVGTAAGKVRGAVEGAVEGAAAALPGGRGLPLVGQVRAGEPTFADEHVEDHVSVPELAGGRDGEYVLRIRGDSMRDDGILEGDHVVVRRQRDAVDGDIVVALVDDEEATVKRFYREVDHIRLQPANEAYEPIRRSDVAVVGKVVGVLRTVA